MRPVRFYVKESLALRASAYLPGPVKAICVKGALMEVHEEEARDGYLACADGRKYYDVYKRLCDFEHDDKGRVNAWVLQE